MCEVLESDLATPGSWWKRHSKFSVLIKNEQITI